MNDETTWLAALATMAVLAAYEAALALARRHYPHRMARSAHAALREAWFVSVSAQPGSEILAVQTLRNSLMSATMTASSAALGLMGAVTLSAPSLSAAFSTGHVAPTNARLVLELVVMGLLFASLLSSVMAVRYYNHAGFICAMPVGSSERRRWAGAGASYLRRAGLLYAWGLRHLILVAPLLVALLLPSAGPLAAVVVVTMLYGFDKADIALPE